MDSQLAVDNIAVHPTRDVAFIDRVTLECLPGITTDQHHEFISSAGLVDNPEVTFIEVDVGGVPSGIVAFARGEIHTMFLTTLRGGKAIRAMKAVLAWIWNNTAHTSVASYAYSHRPDAAFFARMSGFKATDKVDDGQTVAGKPVIRTNFICVSPLTIFHHALGTRSNRVGACGECRNGQPGEKQRRRRRRVRRRQRPAD